MRGKHTSLDKDLKRSVKWLETITGVKKIVIGISEACRHKYPPGYIRVQRVVDAGLKANGYSGKGVTTLFIQVEPIEYLASVQAEIAEKFQES